MNRPMILLAAAVLAFAASNARAECIQSFVDCGVEKDQPVTPTYHVECENVVLSVSSLSYDVPAGTFDLAYSEAMSIAMSLRDEFVVTGPVTGTPVPRRVRLRFSGVACAYGPQDYNKATGTMSLRLLDPLPGENPASVPFIVPYSTNCFVSFADSVDLVFTRPAGTPFGLEIHGESRGGYNFTDHARFTFLDLPPGAHVNSCKGYLQEQPTPARATSWGSLKAAYR